MKPRVVALGQNQGGDDGVGLAVAARLREDGIDVEVLRDASSLVECFEQQPKLVLVDAVLGGGAVGEVLCIEPAQLETKAHAVSSHALSVSEALGLAKVLFGEAALNQVFLVGVVIERPSAFSEGFSPEVARAVEPAVRAVKALLSD